MNGILLPLVVRVWILPVFGFKLKGNTRAQMEPLISYLNHICNSISGKESMEMTHGTTLFNTLEKFTVFEKQFQSIFTDSISDQLMIGATINYKQHNSHYIIKLATLYTLAIVANSYY